MVAGARRAALESSVVTMAVAAVAVCVPVASCVTHSVSVSLVVLHHAPEKIAAPMDAEGRAANVP